MEKIYFNWAKMKMKNEKIEERKMKNQKIGWEEKKEVKWQK